MKDEIAPIYGARCAVCRHVVMALREETRDACALAHIEYHQWLETQEKPDAEVSGR